jgi:predicted alpha/beta-hydrolase family hydrolase
MWVITGDRRAGTLMRMAIRFYVGHGASGSAASMAGHVRGLVARGVDARAIDLPLRKAEAAVEALRAIVPDGPGAPGADGIAIAVGGQSYGGRVASLAAAEPDTDYAALVLFSYPLHAPGAPGKAAERTAHWPAIRCPVLLLSGEADPFARIELLRAAVPLLRDAELVTYPRLGHTLKPVLDDALDRTAAFLLRYG